MEREERAKARKVAREAATAWDVFEGCRAAVDLLVGLFDPEVLLLRVEMMLSSLTRSVPISRNGATRLRVRP